MKIEFIPAVVAIALIGLSAPPSQATDKTVDTMPAKLETQWALSALPPALRDKATVYLLEPRRATTLAGRERVVWPAS